MVRFFFDLMTDGVLSPDDIGLQFTSDEAAEHEAMQALAEMAIKFVGFRVRSIGLLVRDETGAHLCTLTLALSLER